MRIAIDMQGAQGASSVRGIGRYVCGLVGGLLRNKKDHDIHLALNGMLPIDHVRDIFCTLLPDTNIHIWYPFSPVRYCVHNTEKNRKISASIYTKFIQSLDVDILLACSMIEGWYDDFFCYIQGLKNTIPTACVIYDFLQYNNPKRYLSEGNEHKVWYAERFQQLGFAKFFLPISQFTRMCRQLTIADE